MEEPPEVYVPLNEQPKRSDWRLSLARLWCVLGIFMAAVVLFNGEHEVHFRAAIFTLGGFYAVWQLVAWITRPVLPK